MSSHSPHSATATPTAPAPYGGKAIVLVGLMGAGKTTVGRRLAQRLDLPFVDADAEVEAAAGLTIPEIFERHGEPAFRDGERKVIARLLSNGPQVLATGGGAFMDPETRARVAKEGISVWLKANLDVLMKRVGKRPTRPLLKADNPRAIMEKLMAERNPVYAEADIALETGEGPHEEVVDRLVTLLEPYK
ncbi:shikimate kinase [Pyruvatibacter mobilis]|uniref:shikimate kinase n=1 Tax=Pyruvatibacter mobilis TaxID=1712261 RepID=UPI003C7CF725